MHTIGARRTIGARLRSTSRPLQRNLQNEAYCRFVDRRQVGWLPLNPRNPRTSANKMWSVSRLSSLPLPDAGDLLQLLNVKDSNAAVAQFHQTLPFEIPQDRADRLPICTESIREDLMADPLNHLSSVVAQLNQKSRQSFRQLLVAGSSDPMTSRRPS